MKIRDIITEGLSYPVICVDVQPAYDNPVNQKIINFVTKQTGPVLFFVNAQDTGTTDDHLSDIEQYWEERAPGYQPEEEGEDENGDYYYKEAQGAINWSRFQVVDKGYGYFRAWMDHGIEESTIIATIRELYKQRVNDTRELEFPPFNRRTATQSLIQGAIEEMDGDPLIVEWTSIAQLKKFSGAYLVGGGRNECLREVELLMNAFNIRYKRINSLVY
jgi:hypothetical protein